MKKIIVAAVVSALVSTLLSWWTWEQNVERIRQEARAEAVYQLKRQELQDWVNKMVKP